MLTFGVQFSLKQILTKEISGNISTLCIGARGSAGIAYIFLLVLRLYIKLNTTKETFRVVINLFDEPKLISFLQTKWIFIYRTGDLRGPLGFYNIIIFVNNSDLPLPTYTLNG